VLVKKPSKRCRSAQELADELTRYLNHEPIHARPVGVAGRSVRWCMRHPLLATCVLLTVALLLTLAVGVPYELLQRAELDQAQQTAQLETAQAAQLDYYVGVASIRELRRKQRAGWTWAATRKMKSLSDLPEELKDKEELRSLISAIATSEDWRSVQRFAEGFHADDIAVDRTGRLLPMAEIRSTAACRVRIYEVQRQSDGQVSVRQFREWSGSMWDGAVRNFIAGLGLSNHKRAEGFRSVCFSADGKQLAVGTRHGELWVWAVDSNKPEPLQHLSSVSDKGIGGLVISNDNLFYGYLATGRAGLYVLEQNGTKPIWTSNPKAHLSTIATTHDDRVFFTQGTDIYQNQFGGVPVQSGQLTNPLYQLVVSASGDTLIGSTANSNQSEFQAYDTLTGDITMEFDFPNQFRAMGMYRPVLTSNDLHLISTLNPNVVGLWDSLSGAMVSSNSVENTDLPNAAWMADAKVVVVADGEGTKLHELRSHRSENMFALRSVVNGAGAVEAFDISDDGTSIAVLESGHSHPSYSRVRQLDLQSLQETERWTMTAEHVSGGSKREIVPQLAFDPHGNLLAAMRNPGCWAVLNHSGLNGPEWPTMPERITPQTSADGVLEFELPAQIVAGKTFDSALNLTFHSTNLTITSSSIIEIDVIVGDDVSTRQVSATQIANLGTGWQSHNLALLSLHRSVTPTSCGFRSDCPEKL